MPLEYPVLTGLLHAVAAAAAATSWPSDSDDRRGRPQPDFFDITALMLAALRAGHRVVRRATHRGRRPWDAP